MKTLTALVICVFVSLFAGVCHTQTPNPASGRHKPVLVERFNSRKINTRGFVDVRKNGKLVGSVSMGELRDQKLKDDKFWKDHAEANQMRYAKSRADFRCSSQTSFLSAIPCVRCGVGDTRAHPYGLSGSNISFAFALRPNRKLRSCVSLISPRVSGTSSSTRTISRSVCSYWVNRR